MIGRRLTIGLAAAFVAVIVAGSVTGLGEGAARSDRAVHPPPAHEVLKGIFDDNQIVYGDPDQAFAQLKQLRTDVAVVTLWWGGPNGIARRKPAHASDPNDPAYRWDTADRTVRIGQSDGVSIIFTIIGTPAWANRSAGWNVAPTVMNDLRQFVFAAATTLLRKVRRR